MSQMCCHNKSVFSLETFSRVCNWGKTSAVVIKELLSHWLKNEIAQHALFWAYKSDTCRRETQVVIKETWRCSTRAFY